MQVISIGRVMKLLHNEEYLFCKPKTYSIYVQGLISLINLTINFNLPLFLYDGMTELWKSGISLLFLYAVS